MDAAGRPAGVSRELDAAVLRVWSSNGNVVGSGFLVDPSHVVTCAHVVTSALGRADPQMPSDDDVVRVDFPLIAPNNLIDTRVEVWRAIEGDDSGDIAVLSFVQEPPQGLIPARLISGGGDFWGHPFRAFGFPRHHDHGVWAAGVLRASQGAGWVQMEGSASGYAVEGGFSGGAVWDDALAGVVGMTVAADSDSGIRAAYLIPADTLMQAWPKLAEQTVPPCPYRGLSPFRMQDVAVFFGREDLTERLLREVANGPLVALVGPSGSGKSSVLFAGLLPRLPQSKGWMAVSMRPAQALSPVLSLSGALVDLFEPNLSETKRIDALHSLAKLILDGHLPYVIDRVITRAQATRLILAVDQFEELFGRDWADVVEFTHILLSAMEVRSTANPPRFTVMMTMRADFLNEALQDPALATALEDSVIAIGQMGRTQLRSVIEGPLPPEVTYEAGLIDRILGEVGEKPGSLPMLEFALTLLWERQERGVLTHAAYDELGGVKGALAAYAEAVYSEQLLPGDRDNTRRLFVQLARPSEVGTPVRRVARRAELGEVRWQLAQRLAATRLLVTDRDPTGIESVELVHEALIAGWARLENWIEVDRSFRAWQEHLRNSLAAWEKVNEDPGGLLRGAPLAEAESWLREREEDLGEAEANFIRLGVAWRGRSMRRLRIAVATLTLLLLAAISLGSLATWQFSERAQQTRLAGSRDLARQAETLASSDVRTAMLLAGAAYRMEPTPESIRTITTIANDYRQIDTVVTTDLRPIRKVDFSPQDPNLLAIHGSQYVALWDLHSNSRRFIREFDTVLGATAFSPDGKVIAIERTGINGSKLSLWHLADNQIADLPAIKLARDSMIDAMQFSNDRSMLAVCTEGVIQIWALKTQKLLSRISSSETCGFGFTSDQNLAYVRDRKVVIWNPVKSRIVQVQPLPRTVTNNNDNYTQIYVAPNGRTSLVWDSSGGPPTWWDLDRGTHQKHSWPALQGINIEGVSFTRDSRFAIVAGDGDFVAVDLSKRRLIGAYALPTSEYFRGVAPINADHSALAVNIGTNSFALVNLRRRPGVPIEAQEIAIPSDDPRRLASLTEHGVAYHSYDQADEKLVPPVNILPPQEDEPYTKLSPSGHQVAIATGSPPRISLVDVESTRAFAPLALPALDGDLLDPEFDLEFDPLGKFLVWTDASNIVVWSVTERRVEKRLDIPKEFIVQQVAVSTDGDYVAAIDNNGQSILWEVSSGAETKLSEDSAVSLAFSPVGGWLSVVTSTQTQLWELGGSPRLSHYAPVLELSEGGSTKFSPDARYLATRNENDNGNVLGTFVWSVPDLQLLGTLQDSVDFLFLPGDQGVVSAGTRNIEVVSFDPKHSLEIICRVTGNGNLSGPEWERHASGFKYIATCP